MDVVNSSAHIALMTVLSVRDAGGKRSLPMYPADNYFPLLPGEKRHIAIECPGVKDPAALRVRVSGWNVPEQTLDVK